MTRFSLLLFMLLPAPLIAGDLYVSHPGGELDRWIHDTGQPTVVSAAHPTPASPAAVRSFYAAESYPTHSVSWHIIGSRESREELIDHLMTHPEHADVRRIYTANDLHRMSRSQLMTLHDDSHERRIAGYSTRAVSATALPTVTYAAPRVQYVQSGGCPGGVCPVNSSSRRSRRSRQSASITGASTRLNLGLINVSRNDP